MDFWRRSARKSRKKKARNVNIREIMEVGKNILEVTEERRSMTNRGMTEEDTRDRDRWRNLVLGEPL
jgi:phosphosulfolactate synthase (CoM biosynthesis protein A)